MYIDSKKDSHAPQLVTCAANTSETCSYTWKKTHASSKNNSPEVFGPTITLTDLDIEHNSIKCFAECKIRNSVCASEPMFINLSPEKGEPGQF